MWSVNFSGGKKLVGRSSENTCAHVDSVASFRCDDDGDEAEKKSDASFS